MCALRVTQAAYACTNSSNSTCYRSKCRCAFCCCCCCCRQGSCLSRKAAAGGATDYWIKLPGLALVNGNCYCYALDLFQGAPAQQQQQQQQR
jgi:hypothetical protein